MKTLIAYATKSGASRKCAELLAARIQDCSILDLSKQVPALQSFDVIVLGSGVRMGKIYRPMKSFMENNAQALLSKKTAFFLCNAYPSNWQRTVEKNIPKALLDRALGIESLGGIPPFTAPQNEDWLLSENLERLVQAVASKG